MAEFGLVVVVIRWSPLRTTEVPVMVHTPDSASANALQRYLNVTEHALDAYKQNKIDHTELYDLQDQASVLFVHQLKEAFHVRQRNLQAFRAIRGRHLPVGDLPPAGTD
jgi:predicted metal-dependent TIM-barrel fold hydrolase